MSPCFTAPPDDDVKAALPDDVSLFTQTPCQSVPEEVADRILDSLGYTPTGN